MITSSTGRFFAVVAVAGLLAACDQPDAVATANAATTAPTMRPHSGPDPHASLGPEKLVQVVLQHRAEGREAEARTALDSAIAKFPGNAELVGMRGALRLEQGQTAEALKDLEAAVSLEPSNAAILTNRAQAYRRFKREDEALADLNRAIKLKPDFVPARFNRGTILFSRGDYKSAFADFDHCVAVDPHTAAPYFNRAIAQDSLGNRKAAIADIERFIKIANNDGWKKTANEMLASWKKGGDASGAKPTPKSAANKPG